MSSHEVIALFCTVYRIVLCQQISTLWIRDEIIFFSKKFGPLGTLGEKLHFSRSLCDNKKFINLRCIDSAHAPVQNRDQFATQSRNKCFLMKIDKHLEYSNTRTVLKLVLGLYLQFQGLSSSITLNIITLPTSDKSVVVKNLP